jgi:putative ABC transport system permease protein
MMRALMTPWVWRLAWRDSRSSRRRLVLYALSISLGIAALVAIGSLGRAVRRAIDDQAKGLLGADVVLSSRKPFGDEERGVMDRLGGERSDEVSFASMIQFPGTGGTRLVNVRALSGGFPYYGALETDPPGAAEAFRRGEGVLVEEGVARQFGAGPGSPAKLGEWKTKVVGLLRRVPGDSVAFTTLAPRVYLAGDQLPRTKLLGRGALVRYRAMLRLPDDADAAKRLASLRPRLRELKLDVDTAEKRKANLGKAAENLNGFLNLVAFIALLLGAVGIASAIHVHVRQRLPQVAVLRCLGAPMASTFAVYLLQSVALGVIGIVAGTVLGAAIHHAVPAMLRDKLPFPLEASFSWVAAGQAAVAGLGVSLSFALMPLLSVRRVSPLAAIRAAYDAGPARFDAARWLVGAGIAASVVGFALLQTRSVRQGLGFAAGLAVAFGLLALAARGLVWLARSLPTGRLPFAWRQGLASLHRPNNRTGTLLVALGLGTFLIVSLQLTRASLLGSLRMADVGKRANAVLFDVQPDQLEGVVAALGQLNLPVVESAPIVTMRLKSVRGRLTTELATNRSDRTPGWVLQREYRCTWRTNLADSERLVSGTFTGRVSAETSPVPVSLELGIARDLGLEVGDRLSFDVQGQVIDAVVGSLREVEWRQVRPNFFVVFPEGALEAAPAMHVLATRVANPSESARMQREVVQKFPNVSVIDLALVLDTVEGVVSKVALGIRLMALFTVLTGVVVLLGAIVTGRSQRLQEAVLLRTLGGSRATVRRILAAEYAGLGLLAGIVGCLLAMGAAAGLARFVFKTSPTFPAGEIALALVAVPLLTLVVGLLASRGISSSTPLAILRGEQG